MYLALEGNFDKIWKVSLENSTIETWKGFQTHKLLKMGISGIWEDTLAKEALTVAENTSGPNHPNVATFLNNLTALYQAQGKYAEVEPLYKRALTIAKKILGPEHPHVATINENLAELYQKMGKKDDAQKLKARAKKIRSNR